MRLHRPLHLAVLSATVLALPAPGQAQEYDLGEIIVSGGLSAIAPDAYGRAYTVLTAEEIEKKGLTTVQDALRAIPGLSVSGSGASLAQIRIRGGEASHTLVLIDGIEAAGGADEYVLSGLETSNIERIEVLRGPQSVYYGSNASAGVINIITRKGTEPGLHYGGSVEAGNGGAASFFLSQRADRGGLSFNLSSRYDRAFDESGDGGERDSRRRTTATLAGDYRLTDAVTLGFTLRRAEEHYKYDSASWTATDAASYIVDDPFPYSDRKETTGALWTEVETLDGRLTHRLEYQDSVFDQGYDGGPATRGETRKFKYRLSYALDGQPVANAAHLVNVLAERQEDSSTSVPGHERTMNSVALEYRGLLENGLDIQAGVRHDDNQQFKDFTSWNLGLSWRVPGTVFRLHGSAGTGLVNPSFFELYANANYGTSIYLGNANLSPEENRSFDLGVEAELLGGRGLLDVTYFNEKLEGEIESYLASTSGGVGTWTFRNQSGTSTREGVEVTGRLQATDTLSLALNYTYLNAHNPDGTVEIRRPKQEIGLSGTLAILDGRGQVTADIRHVAGNWDTQYFGSYATTELPDYTTVNLSAGYDLNDNVRLTGRIVNVFDEDYSDVWGYANQGRAFYAGLEAKW